MTEEDKAFEHWTKTGKYLYKGIEYSKPPSKMVVDAKNGTIEVGSVFQSTPSIIIHRVPDHILFTYEIYNGKMVIDLDNTPYRGSIPSSKDTLNWKLEHKEPLFYAWDVPLHEVLYSDTNVFGLVDRKNRHILVVQNVPSDIIRSVFTGTFTQITLGMTGRYWAG